MEPNDLRYSALIEVAADRVADLHMQICHVVGLGEDRFPQGPCSESSLGGFFDEEDHFRQAMASPRCVHRVVRIALFRLRVPPPSGAYTVTERRWGLPHQSREPAVSSHAESAILDPRRVSG